MKAVNRLLLLVLLTEGATHVAAAQTVLRITQVPANTPPADTVFVAGSFNGWNPHSAAYALTKNPDGTYHISLPARLGAIEYKFTRGRWEKVEAGPDQQSVANRQADLRQEAAVTHKIASWAAPGALAPKKHTASPQVHVISEAFRLPQFGRTRRVWVYLPADYAQKPQQRYPVLYLHDGHNVFDEATSFGGEWGVDETLDHLAGTGQGPAPSIVVAVDHGNQYRTDEYLPWRNAELKGGGQGGAYVDFLALTLKPYIDAHYRTKPDAAHTGVTGSSLGGLISVYAALKYPRVYGLIGVFSPAFWVSHDSLKAFAKTHPAAPTARFYFVGGPQESETMLPLMAAWRAELRAQGVPATNVSFHAPADGQHREWFWQREFPAAYQFLFGAAPKEAPRPARSK